MKKTLFVLMIMAISEVAFAQIEENLSGQKEGEKTVVGAINGMVDVTALGGASYTIPIQVPEGINGMQPNISINYNSQARNGILGWGWNLAGASAITRVGQTLYHDGKTKGVDFNDDRFALDGQRLLLVNSQPYGGNGAEYRTEVDGMVKIVSYTCDSTNGPAKFKVWFPNGNIAYYGYKENTRIGLNQRNDVCMWMLDSVVDRNGNYVAYRYTKERTACRLKRILYTGNSQANIIPAFRIELEYADRFDKEIAFVDNNVLQQRKLLTGIKVYKDEESNGLLLWRYDLKYVEGDNYATDNIYSRLKTVNFICDDKKYNPTVIGWDATSYQAQIHDITLGGNVPLLEMSGVKFTGDFNGDGFTDVIGLRETPYEMHVFLNDGHPDVDRASFRDIAQYNRNENLDWIYVGDFDGDGLDDFMCVIREKGFFWDYLVMKPYITRKNDDGSVYFVECEPLSNGDYLIGKRKELTLVMGDFLGDKKMSFIYQTHKSSRWRRHFYIYYNGDYSNNCPFGERSLPDLNAKCMRAADFNGDGKTEIWYYTNNDSDWYGKIVKLTSDYDYETVNDRVLARNDKVFVGDFNGDGHADLLSFVGNDSIWKIHLFKENEFYWQSYDITDKMPIGDPGDHGFSINNDDGTYKAVDLADFNGDGKCDIAVVGEVYGREYLVFLFAPFNTNGCAQWVPIMIEETGISSSDQREICVGNFLGRENVSLFTRNKTFAFPPLTDRYSVQNITDGMGNQVGFRYRYLMSKGGFYKITHNEPFLGDGCYAVALPIKGVTDITKGNTNLQNIFNTETLSFYYQDAIIHNRGEGFLGFEKAQIVHSQGYGAITTHKRHFKLNTTGLHRYMMLDSDSCFVTPRGGGSYNEVLASVDKYSYVKTTNSHNQKVYMPLCDIQIGDQFDIYNGGRFINRNITKKHYEETPQYQNTVHCTLTIQGTGLGSDEIEVEGAPFRTFTETKYQQENYNQWIVNRPYSIKTQTVSNEEPEHPVMAIATCNYNNDNPFLVMRRTVYPGGTIDPADPLATYTETQYDEVGNVDFVTTGDLNNVLTTTTVDYVYYPNKRQLKKEVNQMGYVKRYTYDPTLGYCNSSTDCNGLVTHFLQDPMGVVSQTNYPDGTMSHIYTSWVDDADILKPQNATYCQITQCSGESDRIVYYDALGNELRRVSYGFDGEPICVDTKYNGLGKPVSISEPFYFFNMGGERSTSFHYDDFNRNDITIAPDGTSVETEIDGFTTTITHSPAENSELPNQITSSTVNAAGWVVMNVDANNTTVNYGYYPDGKLKWTQIGEDETTRISLEYDNAGNRTLLMDPDYGVVSSIYNAYGQLRFNTDPKGNITEYRYDGLGRNDVRIETDSESGEIESTIWVYDRSGKNRLDYIYSHNQAVNYEYDNLGRLIKVQDKRLDSGIKTTSYQYDEFSRVRKVTYPTGYTIRKMYNEYGYLTHIKDNDYQPLWKTVKVNEFGQVSEYRLGNNINCSLDYDESHRLQLTNTEVNGEIIQSFYYHYNDFSNLDARKDNKRGMEESFLYDDLNRLTTITMNGVESSMGYDPYGRLISKQVDGQDVFTDAKYETYDLDGNLKPHAISQATMPNNLFPTQGQSIVYTMFDKVKTISQDNRTLSYDYGYDHQRIHMEEQVDGELVATKDYYGNCEIIDNGTPIPHTYLSGPLGTFAVVRNVMGGEQVSYILKDHLGSWTAIIDSDGNLMQELSFDAWGNLRDPETWSGEFDGTPMLDRGFTGHEHLYDFGLINMNGRMYDPVMSSFLSVDNYVQQPDNSQNFNRYTYCLNNPLKYTDPSGEEFGVFAAVLFASMASVIINGVVNSCSGRNFYDGSFGAFVSGAASGAAGYYAGGAVAGALNFDGFFAGAITGSVGSAAGGFVGDFSSSLMAGYSLEESLLRGFISSNIGALSGALIGGLSRGLYVYRHGGNFWTGDDMIIEYLAGGKGTKLETDYNNSMAAKCNDEWLHQKTFDRMNVGEGEFDINVNTTTLNSDNPKVSEYSFATTGQYLNKDGYLVNGFRCRCPVGGSELHISPACLFATDMEFDATVGHELIHAYHYYKLKRVSYKYTEMVAHEYSYNVYQSHGFYKTAQLELMNAIKLGYGPGTYPAEYVIPSKYPFSLNYCP